MSLSEFLFGNLLLVNLFKEWEDISLSCCSKGDQVFKKWVDVALRDMV